MGLNSIFNAISRITKKKWSFLVAFLVVFFFTLSGLFAFGAVPTVLLTATDGVIPEIVPGVGTSTPQSTALFPDGEGEMPIGIEIPKVGVKANVGNPATADIPTLDAALLKGAVRYPSSARLGEEGNVLIFGHSSNLPVVQNQAFKAFNEIATLVPGDEIYVYSNGRRYAYAVEEVRKANTATDGIPLNVDGSKLTLATCDNFGDKTDRFIVTASLVAVAQAVAPE